MITFIVINIIYWSIAYIIYKIRLSKDKDNRMVFSDFGLYDKLLPTQRETFWSKSTQLSKKLLLILGGTINLAFTAIIFISDDTLIACIVLLSYILPLAWYLCKYNKLKNTFSFRK